MGSDLDFRVFHRPLQKSKSEIVSGCGKRENPDLTPLRRREFLFQQLFLVQRGVESVLTDQLVVGAALGDASLVQQENDVGVAHGRDPVRHDDRRPLAHHAAQSRQNLLFRVGIHRRQRVVENQYRGIDDDRARERRPLFLAARQRDAALAHHRVVALGKVGDVLVETRDRGRGHDPFVTLG